MNSMQFESKDPFFGWFRDTISFLWSFSHFFSRANSEYFDEMLYILNLSRSGISRTLKKGNAQDEATMEFLKLWFKRSKKSTPNYADLSGHLTWEEQFLLFALLNQNISVAKVASLLQKKEASVKFQFLSALAKVSGIPETEIRTGTRDCVRHDLYYTDFLLKSFSPDPLDILRPQTLDKHLEACSRCQKIEKILKDSRDEISSREVFGVPAQFREQVIYDFGTRWDRLVRRELFGAWPLWAKVPIQLGLVFAVLMFVLSSTRISLFSDDARTRLILWSDARISHLQGKLTKHWEAFVVVARSKILDWSVETQSADSAVTADSNRAVVANISSTEALTRFLNQPDFMKDSAELTGSASLALLAPERKNQKTPAVDLQSRTSSETSKPDARVPDPVTSPLAAKNTPVPIVKSKVAEASTASGLDPKGQTIFYRWGAYSRNLVADANQIGELLKIARAEEAGELRFGADYLGGKYFHFSIPVGEFELLMQKVKGLGIRSFSSNQADSDRVIPPDRTRVVFLLLPQNSSDELNRN